MKRLILIFALLLISCSDSQRASAPTGPVLAGLPAPPVIGQNGNALFDVVMLRQLYSSAPGAANGVLIDDHGDTYFENVNCAGVFAGSRGYSVRGLQVIGERQPHIEPSNGSAADNARAINELLAALEAHGLLEESSSIVTLKQKAAQ